jgi:hypothetical protein
MKKVRAENIKVAVLPIMEYRIDTDPKIKQCKLALL